MPKRTIYVRDEDVALFDKVAEEGSLSAVIARAVKADRGEAPGATATATTAKPEEVFTPGRFIEFSVEKEDTQDKKPVPVVDLLDVDPFLVEVGKGLLSLVDPNQGAKLLERIGAVRRALAVKLGIIIPGVRFRDNLKLRPNEYQFRLRDGLIAIGSVEVNRLVVFPREGKLPDVPGTRAIDPVTESPVLWVGNDARPQLKEGGFMIFDPVSVIASHLTQVIEQHAAVFLGITETELLLGRVRKSHAVLVNSALPDVISLVQLWRLLRMLLRERVSIRDLVVILETVLETGATDLETLLARCRLALRIPICRAYTDKNQQIPCATLSPELEEQVRAGDSLNLVAALQKLPGKRVLLVANDLRPRVRDLVLDEVPDATILSYAEARGCKLDATPLG